MIRRACSVAAMAMLPVAGWLPAAHADVFFQAETNATAIHITVTQQPASSIIVASLLDDAASYASSAYDSGNTSEALAASAFPGRLVVQGPQLLCSELFSCPVTPPNYPLLADASYPRRSHDTATVNTTPTGSGPFVVTPLSADATAGSDGNQSTTQAGAVRLLAGTPGALTIGSSTATTSTRLRNETLDVTVSSAAQDIAIGDLVHIDAVHAVDHVTLTPGSAPVASPLITVSGVTVGGHSASLDDKGLHVEGIAGPGLSQQVAEQGISIHTVGAQHQETKNGSQSDATALVIDTELPVNGVPYVPNPLPPLPPPFDQIPALPGVNANGVYVAHITLGAVGAAAGLGTEPSFDLGAATTPPTSYGAPSPIGSATASGPLGGRGLVAKLARPTQSLPTVAASPASVLRGFVDVFSKNDMETLYLVLALGSLVLFVGWRAIAAFGAGRRLR